MKVTHAGNNEIVQEDEVIEITYKGMTVLQNVKKESTYLVSLYGTIGEKSYAFPYRFTREFMETITMTDEQRNSIIADIFKRNALKFMESK